MTTQLEFLVIEWVIHSLRENPEQWKADSHWISHEKGTQVWIGNQWWGVHVDDKGFSVKYDGPENYYHKYKRRYPGFWERVLFREKPEDWRSKVWSAYEIWKADRNSEKIMEWVKSR